MRCTNARAKPHLTVGASGCPGGSVIAQTPGPHPAESEWAAWAPGPGIRIVKRLPGDSGAHPCWWLRLGPSTPQVPPPAEGEAESGVLQGPHGLQGAASASPGRGLRTESGSEVRGCLSVYVPHERECDATRVNPGVWACAVTKIPCACGVRKWACLCVCAYYVCELCVGMHVCAYSVCAYYVCALCVGMRGRACTCAVCVCVCVCTSV